MVRIRWAILAILCFAFCTPGCVSPTGVKQASVQQTANLIKLEQAVLTYQKAAADHYDKMIAAQRQAYIARMVGHFVDEEAIKQTNSLQNGVPPNALPDRPALDFIEGSVRVSEQFQYRADRFDMIFATQGNTLDDKLAAMTAQANALEQEATRVETDAGANISAQKKNLVQALRRDAKILKEPLDKEEIPYLSAAISLKETAKVMNDHLDVLLAQVHLIQSFHGLVDQYIGTDATIDGKAIAASIAAGSNADLSKLPTLQAFIESQK